MKLFQSSQKHFALLGITPSQSHEKYPILNGKILTNYFWNWFTAILFSVNIFYEANNFQEYVELIYRMLMPVLIVICFTIIICKMDILFQFIDSCEKIVDKSKPFHWIFYICKSIQCFRE